MGSVSYTHLEVIPETLPSQKAESAATEVAYKGVTEEVETVADGQVIAIDDVKDPVFSQKMMGEGVGFVFESDVVCAPCDGEIMVLMPTKHAFGIKAKNGAEVLVHIGLDTVNLQGEGFTALAKVNEKVKAHQPIIQIDREFMKAHNVNLTTPMVVSNKDQFEVQLTGPQQVSTEDEVLIVKKK